MSYANGLLPVRCRNGDLIFAHNQFVPFPPRDVAELRSQFYHMCSIIGHQKLKRELVGSQFSGLTEKNNEVLIRYLQGIQKRNHLLFQYTIEFCVFHVSFR